MTEKRPADDCEYKLRKKMAIGRMGGTSSAEDVKKEQSDKKGSTFLKSGSLLKCLLALSVQDTLYKP